MPENEELRDELRLALDRSAAEMPENEENFLSSEWIGGKEFEDVTEEFQQGPVFTFSLKGMEVRNPGETMRMADGRVRTIFEKTWEELDDLKRRSGAYIQGPTIHFGVDGLKVTMPEAPVGRWGLKVATPEESAKLGRDSKPFYQASWAKIRAMADSWQRVEEAEASAIFEAQATGLNPGDRSELDCRPEKIVESLPLPANEVAGIVRIAFTREEGLIVTVVRGEFGVEQLNKTWGEMDEIRESVGGRIVRHIQMAQNACGGLAAGADPGDEQK